MKIISHFTVVFVFIFMCGLFAQGKLYVPLNIQKVYRDSTRSNDGKPGKKYWQNGSDYKIFVSVDPQTRKLSGREVIIYHNNSPKSLNRIVMHNYQDYYKKGVSRDYNINPDAVTDGVIIDRLIINDEEIDLNSNNTGIRRSGTNMFVPLSNPLESGSSIVLELSWSFVIPNKSLQRMGAYDSTSFFVAYWYPQVSVFDDIDGWDTQNYGGQVEFYNDFSNYDVKITVPKNFVVWATGVLQNPEEIFTKKILNRYTKARTAEKVINVVTKDNLINRDVTNSDDNTYHFTAKNVTEFTFGMSNHYLWDMTSLVVDKNSGRRTVVGSAYKEESKNFKMVAQIARDAIYYFSNKMPAVPFPYPELTVFNGSGGMESPMMVNEGEAGSKAGAVRVTSHEIAHTYFPFYMGINETKYAFMDEGWATFLPTDFQANYVKDNDPLRRTIIGYQSFAGNESEMPLSVPSTHLRGTEYRTSAYVRPGSAYEILRDFLGEKKFLKGLHTYMSRWNGKHPIPYDFFYSFNDALGENLNWFWKPWFFDFGYPDLAIKDVKVEGKFADIIIEKIGVIPIPIKITVYSKEGEETSVTKQADIWADGKTEVSIKVKSNNPITEIKLGSDHIPDSVQDNNIYKVN